MNDSRDRLKTRRELLTSSARAVAAAGLAVLTVLLMRGRNASPSRNCNITTPCSQCGSFTGCVLSRAKAVRATLKERKEQ